MTKTNWSQGPWHWGGITSVSDAQNIPVADLRVRMDSSQIIPNAHLIAAAPDLYAALERAVRELDAAADGLGFLGKIDHADDCRLTVKALMEVLAEARGEA